MQPTTTGKEERITREQLRTFHIAGRGLDFAAPSGALRPAALDQLEQLPAFEPADLRSLYESCLNESRGEARKRFVEKVKRARTSLGDLLSLDDRRKPESDGREVVSAALGAEGSGFFDTGALAVALGSPRAGLRCMEPARRSRVEQTMATLDEALRDLERQPAFYSFEGPDGFEAALDFCDRKLERFADALRAVHTARLDTEAAFDPALHEDAIERFDWQSATAEDLLALPPAVVFETAERLAQASLTSFGRLLRSGRPIHVVVTSCGLYADDLSGFVPDFGYLSIAHREAFVLQSSLSRPEHLAAGFTRLAATLRPAVAIVSVPEQQNHDARLAISLLHLSRAFPLYRYDPDRGATLAERFELLVDEPVDVTAADFAAVSPAFKNHFRILPVSAWDGEQMELSEYLKLYITVAPRAIPYLCVTGEDGLTQRAVITRELVNLCRDRMRAWKMFEGLAEPRQQQPANADARLEGANLAIQQVLAMLARPAAVHEEQTTGNEQPPTANAERTTINDEPPTSEDPYIDSYLCTSCNDCFRINPRVFQYDGNKQAFIADARAGTFAELVKAAEGCPAKCIHPGTPRSGDATVTPQLLAKASKLG